MKLVAIKSFTYAGKRVNAGDTFESKTDRDAKLLVGIKNARLLEHRAEVKIPAPTKKLVEQASAKPESIIPTKTEEIELPENTVEDEKEEVKTEEVKTEEVKTEEVKTEEVKTEEVKPTTATTNNNNKRTYNKRK